MPSMMEWVAGNPATVRLQHLILNLLVFLGLLTGLYFGVSDIIVGLDLAHKIFDVVLTGVFAFLYWLSRFRGHFLVVAHVTTLVGLLLVGFNFIISSGIHGPTNMVFLFVLACITLLHTRRAAIVYLIYALLVSVACFSIQYWRPEWILHYVSPQAEFWDLTMTFFFCVFAVFAVMRVILNFFGQILEGTKTAQAAVLNSEKMASLGAILAGMTHEINTPVGVIGSSLTVAEEWWDEEAPKLPQILASLAPEQQPAFWSFLLDVRGIDGQLGDSKNRRVRRAHLAESLSFLPPDEARSWAEECEALGVSEWNPAWSALLLNSAGQAAFLFALKMLTFHRSNRNASIAYEKLRTLVKALGSYSRSESPDEAPVPTNLVEGLETVLTLYGTGHRHSVDIVKDFKEVPPVLAKPDELIQVWTNLVQNALQAMKFEGVLTIGVEALEGMAVVTISDTGPGVPENLREKIFEPFFTTKERGHGTGLGLGIVGRIIAAQGGTIAVGEALGGGAAFTVKLPLSR